MTGPRKVVVIGGGVAGLASATLLAREGFDVELHEKNASLGGRVGQWAHAGFRFDTGPSWYLMPEVFEHFFQLLGSTTGEQLELIRLDPAYRVFFEDDPQPLDVHSGQEAVSAAFDRVEPGAGERLSAYLESARTTYDLAIRRFLYTTYESLLPLLRVDVVRRLGRLTRLLVQPLDRVIAGYVQDQRLAQVLGYPAVFLGTSPSRAPSIYHLMSHLDLVDGVFYPRGGFTKLVESLTALAETEGVRVHTSSRATKILTRSRPRRWVSGDRRAAEVTGVRFRTAQGEETTDADIVVGAADLHHVETQLLTAAARSRPPSWWSRHDPGTGAVLVLLGIHGTVPQLAHHSLFFTRHWEAHFDVIHGSGEPIPDPASIYVSRSTASDPEAAPEGHENLFMLIPVPADTGMGRGGVDGDSDLAVERVADAAIRQVASWAGVPDLADRIVVRRTIGPQDFADDVNAWSGGALGLAHTARQSAFLRGRNTSRRVAGLFYAGHSTIPGIGLPMCLISAEILLKAVRGDRSTGPLPTPLSVRSRGVDHPAGPTRPTPGSRGSR
jgi:phytoene desaturase